jgi:hypothetical protein
VADFHSLRHTFHKQPGQRWRPSQDSANPGPPFHHHADDGPLFTYAARARGRGPCRPSRFVRNRQASPGRYRHGRHRARRYWRASQAICLGVLLGVFEWPGGDFCRLDWKRRGKTPHR